MDLSSLQFTNDEDNCIKNLPLEFVAIYSGDGSSHRSELRQSFFIILYFGLLSF